jgi:glycerol kinase
VGSIRGLGVTNQRETVVCWDPTGKPYYKAIVWCDTRCKDVCDRFTKDHGNHFKERTGLPVSTYFTLFKILWLKENVPEIQKAIDEDRIMFGTVDTWIIYNLTGKYVTDASNASRTYLYNLKGYWDLDLLKIAGLQPHMLPKVLDSFDTVGTITSGSLKGIAIRSIMGDQQSSAYAH